MTDSWREVGTARFMTTSEKPLAITLAVLALSLLVCGATSSCRREQSSDDEVKLTSEVVLGKGDTLVAQTQFGQVSVVAGEENRRIYKLEECVWPVTLMPRPKRWLGSLGIVKPGKSFPQKCRGVSYLVVEEGQQHFDSLEEAVGWLQDPAGLSWTIRNDGLMLGVAVNPQREQLNVTLWQILIRGGKPNGLPGSSDDSIRIVKAAP
jgi:hypothetical protein